MQSQERVGEKQKEIKSGFRIQPLLDGYQQVSGDLRALKRTIGGGEEALCGLEGSEPSGIYSAVNASYGRVHVLYHRFCAV